MKELKFILNFMIFLVPVPPAPVHGADPRNLEDFRPNVCRIRVQLRQLYGPRQNYQRWVSHSIN